MDLHGVAIAKHGSVEYIILRTCLCVGEAHNSTSKCDACAIAFHVSAGCLYFGAALGGSIELCGSGGLTQQI